MAKEIIQLKITLKDTEPPVWRRLLVPKDITLDELHSVLNAAMGWDDSHMHMFKAGDDLIGNLEYDDWGDLVDETQVQLWEVAETDKTFEYDYDFGDGWKHEVRIEKLVDADPNEKYPVCIGGKNACPPEDCGGTPCFERFKEAVSNPEHPMHVEISEWGDVDFDPEKFDPELVNKLAFNRKTVASKSRSKQGRFSYNHSLSPNP